MDKPVNNQRGGKREGAGRPTTGIERRAYSFRLTVEEHAKVKEFIGTLHEDSKNTPRN